MSDDIELIEVVEGVHRYADGLVNWYLLEEEGELTLVDAGWPGSWPRIRAVLRELDRRLSAVVLTHAHPDHVGAAETVNRKTGAPVHVHRLEIPRALGKAKGSSTLSLLPKVMPQLWRPTAVGFVVHATLRGKNSPTWLTDLTPFESGVTLDVPGHPEVIATHGHTEGHVSLHLPDRGVILTGDAMATLNIFSRRTGPRLMPDALSVDPAQVRRALDALDVPNVDTLLPGHGDPFGGRPGDAIAQAREAGAS